MGAVELFEWFIALWLFVLGTVLEPAPCLILTVPILVPIAQAMQVEPISFGIAVMIMLNGVAIYLRSRLEKRA